MNKKVCMVSLTLAMTIILLACGKAMNSTSLSSDNQEDLSRSSYEVAKTVDLNDSTSIMSDSDQSSVEKDRITEISRDKWIEAYQKEVNDFGNSGSCELIMLNDDEVPEVVYYSNYEGKKDVMVYSYYEDAMGGNVIMCSAASNGCVPEFTPFDGLIFFPSSQSRMSEHNVYKLEDGKFVSLFSGYIAKTDSAVSVGYSNEEHGLRILDSTEEYDAELSKVLARFHDTDFGRAGVYSTKEELWNAMNSYPTTEKCVYSFEKDIYLTATDDVSLKNIDYDDYWINDSTFDLMGYFDACAKYSGISEDPYKAWGLFGHWDISVYRGMATLTFFDDEGKQKGGMYLIWRNEELFGEGDSTLIKIYGTDLEVERHVLNIVPMLVEAVKNAKTDNPLEGIMDEQIHYEGNTLVEPKTEYMWYKG